MQRNLLHITDCHLVPRGEQLQGVDTQASLDAVLVQAVSEATPDAIVATGDLVHAGGTEVYRQFLSLLRNVFDGPLLCLPGNHDFAASMQEAKLPMESLTLGDWHVIGLDSHQDDEPKAYIDAAKRKHLIDQWQQQPGRYGMLATHHPLLPIAAPWLDKDRIEDSEQLLDSLIDASGPLFAGAIFGHAHQVINGCYRQHPLLGTPSTGFQFQPRSKHFAMGEMRPGYRWLTLAKDGQIHSQVRWLH